MSHATPRVERERPYPHALGSNCRDPENRSRKACVCGGHQGRRGKRPRKRWSRA